MLKKSYKTKTGSTFLKTYTGLKSKKDIRREKVVHPKNKGLLKDTNQIFVVVLRPNESVIMERKKKRGRANDQDYEKELKNTSHQLACLESIYIREEWAIDSSDMTVEEIYAKYIPAFVEENAYYRLHRTLAPVSQAVNHAGHVALFHGVYLCTFFRHSSILS